MPQQRKGFTLIELLVVIAIISILAAILFPVFQKVRENARAAACLSNQKQIGVAIQMYVQDYDERLFFYAAKAQSDGTSPSRSGVIVPGTTSQADKDAKRWWNVLMPFIKSAAVFTCPSDAGPTPSNDVNSQPSIPRSYIACRSAESLSLAQIDDPVETLVVMEKWDKDTTGNLVTDSWIEPFNGDFDPDSVDPTRMYKAGNRHTGRVNCVFFDGHAKSYAPATIQNSKDLTGCELIYKYPVPGPSGMTYNGTSTAAGEPNICDPVNGPSHFTYP